jgi:CRISP-associated protein Cas1
MLVEPDAPTRTGATFSVLVIDREGCALDCEGDTLVIREGGLRRGTAPLRLLERLVAARDTQFSGALLARLHGANIGLLIEAPRWGSGQATMLVPAATDRAVQLAQLRRASDPAWRARQATALVRERLAGARALVAAAPTAPSLAGILKRLDAALARLASPQPVETLRGIEGSATAAWYEAYALLVPAPFRFEGRNRRPPRDPVNALLSLGYTMAQFEAERRIAMAGLDADTGLYHETGRDRASLACDLMEPVRPVVERFVLALLSSGDLGIADFSRGGEACLLLKRGRERFYRRFEAEAQPTIRQRLDALAATLRASLVSGG